MRGISIWIPGRAVEPSHGEGEDIRRWFEWPQGVCARRSEQTLHGML